MSDLVEFLRARLDEDEAIARAALAVADRFWRYNDATGGHGPWVSDFDNGTPLFGGIGPDIGNDEPIMRHASRHDPDRVLREVEAKRRIVEAADEATALDLSVDLDRRFGPRDMKAEPYCGDVILSALAAIYADHPDYLDEWKP